MSTFMGLMCQWAWTTTLSCRPSMFPAEVTLAQMLWGAKLLKTPPSCVHMCVLLCAVCLQCTNGCAVIVLVCSNPRWV